MRPGGKRSQGKGQSRPSPDLLVIVLAMEEQSV